jgi:hypothetical protein
MVAARIDPSSEALRAAVIAGPPLLPLDDCRSIGMTLDIIPVEQSLDADRAAAGCGAWVTDDLERRQRLASEAFCAYECLHGSGESEVRRT